MVDIICYIYKYNYDIYIYIYIQAHVLMSHLGGPRKRRRRLDEAGVADEHAVGALLDVAEGRETLVGAVEKARRVLRGPGGEDIAASRPGLAELASFRVLEPP